MSGCGVAFGKHARDRMLERGYSTVDVENALKAGYLESAEPEGLRWRYKICAAGGRRRIVIEFREGVDEVVVITVLEE